VGNQGTIRRNPTGWSHCPDQCPTRTPTTSISPGQLRQLISDPLTPLQPPSRTIHGGVVRKGKQGGATDEAPDLARMTCTVAMTPREWASEEVQQARREGQAAGLSFNHCPHEAGESSGTIHAKRREGFREYELTDAQSEVL